MIDILKKTVSEFSKDSCAAMAAALAYYAVFSLPALLVVVISVAGLVYSPEQVQNSVGVANRLHDWRERPRPD
ncbi:MAG: hypothetical protein R3C99_24725 [Pirellulaceae bacterium]